MAFALIQWYPYTHYPPKFEGVYTTYLEAQEHREKLLGAVVNPTADYYVVREVPK